CAGTTPPWASPGPRAPSASSRHATATFPTGSRDPGCRRRVKDLLCARREVVIVWPTERGRGNDLEVPSHEAAMQPDHAVSRLQWVENSLLRILSRTVSTPVMIDVGAHHGTSLFPFLHNNWQCYAFEPIEENRRQLLANTEGLTRLVARPE